MSKQPDYKVVEINDQAPKSEPKASAKAGGSVYQSHPISNNQPQQTTDPTLKLVRRMSKGLKDCLHSFQEKSIEDVSDDLKRAYRELMVDLEGEKQKHPFSMRMWIVNGFVLLLFIIFLATTRSLHVVHEHRLLNLRIHRWVAAVMVIVCGCPCIRFVTYIVSEPCVWVWKMKYRYLFFYARELKRSVDVTLWFLLALWVWYTWFRLEIVKDKQGAHTLHIQLGEYQEVLKIVVKQITRLLMALAIGAIIWTLKSAVFLKLLADLHFKAFTVRIRQTILDLHGIQFIETGHQWSLLLAQAHTVGDNNSPSSRVGTLPASNNGGHVEARADSAGQGRGQQPPKVMSFWFNVSQLEKETVPIWIIERLTDTYIENMKNKQNCLERLKDTNDDEKLLSEANRMLEKVLDGTNNESCDITGDHLRKYGLDDVEANRVFQLFAPNEKEPVKKITRDQFLRWAVLAVKNCLGLERAIESSRRVFWKLEVLMSSCVVVVTLVIWLLLTDIVSTSQIAILFAPFLSASFIFGDSLKRSFDGIIFVFGMHPFDVGDRVKIGDDEMKVNVINILTTVFIKYDTGVEEHYPNSELTTMPIVNLDTAPHQLPDTIEFTVPIKTRPEFIRDLRINIIKTLDDDLSYTSSTVVAKKEITDDKITLIVYFKYLVSYLSAETRARRRSRILCMIVKLRNEMETAQEKASEQASREEAYAILRFSIDANMKLPKIEELKIKIMDTLRSNKRLNGDPQVLFTGINKDKIAMDVRMRHTKYLAKEELRRQMENAIKVKDEMPEQMYEKQVEVSWHTKSDWDDNCSDEL